MYLYKFELSFAKKRTTLNFENTYQTIVEAIGNINSGIAFRRDRKKFDIISHSDDTLSLTLTSKNSLTNPARSISAITRYLTTYHSDVFKNSIYNKTLFNIILVSQDNLSPSTVAEISNEELLKGLIDLLYGYTNTSNAETISRNKTIEQMKSLIAPYIKK